MIDKVLHTLCTGTLRFACLTKTFMLERFLESHYLKLIIAIF